MRFGLGSIYVLALVGLGFVTGCRPAMPAQGQGEVRSNPTFEAAEATILRDLAATDRRLGRRMRIVPSAEDKRRVSMAGVLADDGSLVVVDGAIDSFSFDARARGLDVARKEFEQLARDAAHAGERELLGRLIEGERLRLEEERELPRAASVLVRGIVDTWQPPRSEREAAEADAWLGRRLAEVRGSLGKSTSLDVVRARELDDALDALERLTSTPAFRQATHEIVQLREALEAVASQPSPAAAADWGQVSRRVQAHLGVTVPPETLAGAFASLAADLRPRAELALDRTGLGKDALAAALDKRMLVRGSCIDAVVGSPMRSMAASQERETACQLRHTVAEAMDDTARAIALVAMHDHVVIAAWALDVARGAATLGEAVSKHRLFLPLMPDTRARYERFALARPVAAIGAGEAVRILMDGEPEQRARAWSAIGDVPFDVVRRELGR